MGDASTKNSIREVDVAPGQGFDHKQPPGIHIVGISTHAKKHMKKRILVPKPKARKTPIKRPLSIHLDRAALRLSPYVVVEF